MQSTIERIQQHSQEIIVGFLVSSQVIKAGSFFISEIIMYLKLSNDANVGTP